MSKYNQDWFKERAFNSLKRIGPKSWDFSDSLLLYMSFGTESYESMQEQDSPYFNLITKPEREYLKSVARDVISKLPNDFEYIDLGPGTEHKENFFFDEIKRQGKNITYTPVDISEYYLNLSKENADKQEIDTKPIQSSFEELEEYIGKPDKPRFVSIGLTFSNYKPDYIIELLKGIAGDGGYVFINTHITDRVDMENLQKLYIVEGETLTNNKLHLVGLNPQKDVTKIEVTKDIEGWRSVINSNDKLREIGIVEGDKLLVFRSLRYTKDELNSALKVTASDYTMFDDGGPFIASLIKV